MFWGTYEFTDNDSPPFSDDEILPRTNEGESKRSHRQHCFHERSSSHALFDSLLVNEIRRARFHVSADRTLEAGKVEIEDKDDLRFSVLHQDKSRCYGLLESRVSCAFVRPMPAGWTYTRCDNWVRLTIRLYSIRFPALETDETAREVVNGILREDFNVTIPNSQKSLIKIMNVWPLKVQEIIRDRVLRESGFVRKDCKLNFDFKWKQSRFVISKETWTFEHDTNCKRNLFGLFPIIFLYVNSK